MTTEGPLSDYLSEHHAFCRLLHDFCDRTRQFSRSEDTVAVRKELLQECLRCANLVSMEYPILEKAAGNAIDFLNESGSDPLMDDIAREIAYLREESTMADDFTLGVMSKQLGQERVPRVHDVVNPFEGFEEAEEEPSEDPPEEESEPEETTEEEEPEPEGAEEDGS